MGCFRQQLDYYRARAAEYDQWWLRQGRYDRGAVLNAQWFADASVVSSALSAFYPAGRVLEFACGTGIWTEQLLPFAAHLTALDGSPEMLAINAARLRSSLVRYVEADLFQWQPTEQFVTVFFGFWLSHVPPERFAEFWQLVRSCLAPGGRVFFVDSRREPTSTAVDVPDRRVQPDVVVTTTVAQFGLLAGSIRLVGTRRLALGVVARLGELARGGLESRFQ